MNVSAKSSSGSARGLIWSGRWLLTRWCARRRRRTGQIRSFRAAIVKVDRLGDFVLAVSAIRLALRHYGHGSSVLVVSPAVEPLAAKEFPGVTRIVVPALVGHARLLSMAHAVRPMLAAIRCEEVVCLRHQRGDWDELLLSWLAAGRTYVLEDPNASGIARSRVTYSYPASVRVRFDGPAPPESEPLAGSSPRLVSRELWRHRALLSTVTGLSVPIDEIMPRFEQVQGRSSGRSVVIVSPYGSHALRDCPEPLLVEALKEVRRHSAAPMLLTGDSGQRERLLLLSDRLAAAGLDRVTCAPAMGVVEFVIHVASAGFVLSTETSTAHLAAAFDRPALLVIGGGHYGEFGPWSRTPRQRWVTRRLDCFGCNWSCIHPAAYCLADIPPEATRQQIRQILANPAVS